MDGLQSPHNHLTKERILDSGRDLTLKWVKIQLTHYVDDLENRLFALAERAGNNDTQSRYFQARDEIKHHQHILQQSYLKHINQAFDNYRANQPTTTNFTLDPLQQLHQSYIPQTEEDLSLIDNNKLEEKLAIGSMSRKISAERSELLYALNQRLSVLRGGTKINEQDNPVAPGVFGEALQVASADLTLDSRAKLVIYKIFESAFMAKLFKLYGLLNHHCESNGVLPNLSYQIKKNLSEKLSELLPEELQAQLSEASIANQVQLFNAIRLLQSRLQPQTALPRPAGAVATPVTQIIAGIQPLQNQAGALLSSLDTPQSIARSDIANLLQQAEQQVHKAENVDADVVEIVGLLFEYMLNDQQLPDSIKALLSYLHTPILKIALLDKDFFNHPAHPARQLLNSLVASGEHWGEPANKYKSEIFLQIKNVVQRLLKEFDNDIRLFSELAFDFNNYLRQHSRRIRLTEKRSMQAVKGQNTLKEIRLKVDGYLKQKIGQIHLPTTIHTLLFEPWANFLSFHLLRFGSRSEQWKQAAQVVDDILWFCQPHNVETDSHARQRIKELQQALPVTLQAGFDTVGYDSNQGKRLLEALQQRQKTAASSAAPSSTTLQPVSANIDAVEISKPATAATKNDKLLMKLKQLQPGTWFEFNADSNNPQRVKLAWSNTDTLHFMFVNRIGQQVVVKSGEQLATDMRSGEVKIIPTPAQRPFFEKAMERVLEQMKQREKTDVD